MRIINLSILFILTFLINFHANSSDSEQDPASSAKGLHNALTKSNGPLDSESKANTKLQKKSDNDEERESEEGQIAVSSEEKILNDSFKDSPELISKPIKVKKRVKKVKKRMKLKSFTMGPGSNISNKSQGFLQSRITSLLNHGLKDGYAAATRGISYKSYLLPPFLRSQVVDDPDGVAKLTFKRAEEAGAFRINKVGLFKFLVLPEFCANGYNKMVSTPFEPSLKTQVTYDSSDPLEKDQYDKLIASFSKHMEKYRQHACVLLPGTAAVKTGIMHEGKEYIENKGTMILNMPGHPHEYLEYAKRFESLSTDGRNSSHFLFKPGAGRGTLIVRNPIEGTIASVGVAVCLDQKKSLQDFHIVIASGADIYKGTVLRPKIQAEMIVCDAGSNEAELDKLHDRSGVYVEKIIEMEPGLKGFIRNIEHGTGIALAFTNFFHSFIVPPSIPPRWTRLIKRTDTALVKFSDGASGYITGIRELPSKAPSEIEMMKSLLGNKNAYYRVEDSKFLHPEDPSHPEFPHPKPSHPGDPSHPKHPHLEDPSHPGDPSHPPHPHPPHPHPHPPHPHPHPPHPHPKHPHYNKLM